MILREFPAGNVAVHDNMDHGVTGNFEVTVNGALVHSKKTKGHGFLHDNPNQQRVVFDAIRAALPPSSK